MRLFALAAVFVAFGVYTLVVMSGHGPLGFLALAAREPWGMQVLLDLLLMLALFASWVVRDARERGLPAWPYVILALTLGSPGALAYLLHRELAARRSRTAAAAR